MVWGCLHGGRRPRIGVTKMADKLTIKAQEAFEQAQRIAEERSHQQIDVEHLMLALLQQEGGIIPQLLQRLGANPAAIKEAIEGKLEAMPKVQTTAGRVYLAQTLEKVSAAARQEAERLEG